jgi:TIR domain
VSTAKRQRFKHDVFISYSHRNKEWVRDWLLPRLRSAGLRVCIDHESFMPGAPLLTEMERAVLQSRKTVAILTPEYVAGGSGWTEFENILVQTLDPAARQRRLIPLLLTPCELPVRLGYLTSIDCTHSADEGLERLVSAISQRLATSRPRAATAIIALSFEVPTGTLAPSSPVYIERQVRPPTATTGGARGKHDACSRGPANGQEFSAPAGIGACAYAAIHCGRC